MKKLITGLFAAVLMAAGLTVVAAQPASADCPYTGCVDTNTKIDAPNKVKKGKKAKICIKVATGGNGKPKGQVTVRVIKSKGSFSYVDSKKYDHPSTCFTTPKLKKKGKYVVRAHFDRKPGSGFKDSDNRTTLKVVKK